MSVHVKTLCAQRKNLAINVISIFILIVLGIGLFFLPIGNSSQPEVTFFEQKVRAERVAFVIDYSLSMKMLGREKVVRKELVQALKGLSDDAKYQMIFFSGSAWVGSDELELGGNGKQVVSVTDVSGKKIKMDRRGNYTNRKIPWLDGTRANIKESLVKIENTPLVSGTTWTEPLPLEMAMAMKPKPEVIFFVTDGLAGGNTERLVERISSDAQCSGIAINTVALMETRVSESAVALSRRTNGLFTVVKKDGSFHVVPLEDE